MSPREWLETVRTRIHPPPVTAMAPLWGPETPILDPADAPAWMVAWDGYRNARRAA